MSADPLRDLGYRRDTAAYDDPHAALEEMARQAHAGMVRRHEEQEAREVALCAREAALAACRGQRTDDDAESQRTLVGEWAALRAAQGRVWVWGCVLLVWGTALAATTILITLAAPGGH